MSLTEHGSGFSSSAKDAALQRQRPATRFLVAQLGSRMHYAVPRMLEAEGMLARFVTDICAVKGWPRLSCLIPPRFRPSGLRRLLGRLPAGVPSEKIRAFTSFGWTYVRRRTSARSRVEQTAIHLWAGKRFCELVLRDGLDGATDVYTFNSAGLEVLRVARSQGIRGFVEQTIAPRRIEQRILAQESERYGHWQSLGHGDAVVEEYCDREQAEWQEAQTIVCGSEFVKESIAACGGPIERCQVVPYGVDSHYNVRPRGRRSGPLRVLTVGVVDLRKGAPYVLETARRLQGRATFRMVGPICVSQSAEADLRGTVELTGTVPRSEVVDQYTWADVFFLPSLCEGSATVTYEALACGLPVVCTPNTGSVVRDGIDGFVVPARDTALMAERLQQFHQDRDRLEYASEQARQRAGDFTLESYRARLTKALSAGSDGACR
jgi:glycosyltransferase involved in cell wall biosynthesis